MLRKDSIRYSIIFLSIFLTPIPYVSLATLCGIFIFLKISKVELFSRRAVTLAFLMILAVLTSAHINETEVDYEETKRLVGVAACAFNLVFFIVILKKWEKSEEERSFSLLFIFFSFLLTTFFWYSAKITSVGDGYPWLKFYGAAPLAIFVSQLSAHSRLRGMKSSNAILGLICGVVFYLNDAKSASILIIIGSLALQKYSYRDVPKLPLNSNVKIDKFHQFSIMRFGIVSFMSAAAFWYSGYRGYLGTFAQSILSPYGGNLFAAIVNARPELRISIAALSEMPWYGLGTPENGMRFALGSVISAEDISIVNLNLINQRVLGDGLNVHSWFFELILRGGFFQVFMFVPLLYCVFQVIKRPNLFSHLPGLYIANLFTFFDLFFSPFTWFSPIQISFALLGYYSMQYRKLNNP